MLETETGPRIEYTAGGQGSRVKLLAQIQKIGISTEALESLTVDQLSDLLCRINYLLTKNTSSKISTVTRTAKSFAGLSSNDKKILRELIVTMGDVSFVKLSRDMQIPRSTLMRRRKRLEDLLERTYTLKYEKFEMRQITFLVSTKAQNTREIGKKAVMIQGVTKVVQILGNQIDLRIEAVVKTNEDVSKLAEQIRAIEGVAEIAWMESISVIGQNKETSLAILESV